MSATGRYAFNRPGRQEHVGRHADWRVPERSEAAACGCMCRVVRRDTGECVRCWLDAPEPAGMTLTDPYQFLESDGSHD